jgi:hypothetical protein
MKILLVTNLYPPNSIGGYERLCATIAEGLATRGHAVQILTSAHGGGSPGSESLPVSRGLRLLVSSRSIYEPFEGGSTDREEITSANQSVARAVVERFVPDILLAGNLMFLDRRFLEALSRLGAPLAYLLTDVWLIQMLDDGWLQEYFRREVLAPAPRDRTGAEELPADILSGARAPVEQAEVARRAGVEERLAAGRSAYQLSGICHLCGQTVFLVRRPTPGTLMMVSNERTSVTCGQCGLDAIHRAVIHAADSVAGERGSPRVGVLCQDQSVAAAVGTRHRGRVSLDPQELAGMEVIADLTRRPVSSPGADAPGSGRAQRRVFAAPRDDTLPEEKTVPFLEVWSERYGYLGRDYLVGVVPVG